MLTTQDWRPVAAYVYILHLDNAALAWEYLRRNRDYQRDWRQQPSAPAVAERWGLRTLENPLYDARVAEPAWLIDADNLTRLTADHGTATDAFALWDAPGYKRLLHDGRRVVLTNAVGHHQLRVAIDDSVHEGSPVAFLVRPDRAPAQWNAIETQLRVLTAARAERAAPIPRPDRIALSHMRGIQALDGVQAGASQREIADILFGADAAAQWESDGVLRNTIRNLLRAAHRQQHGGYRRLVSQFASPEKG